jgi:integrase
LTKKLTTLAFERAKPKLDSGGKLVRNEIADGGADGLYLIVQPSGAKSWAIRYRHNGRATKFTLGRGAALSLAEARKAAADARLALETGTDPAAERRAARAANKAEQHPDTVEALVKQFIALHGPKIRPATLRLYDSALRRFVLPKWAKRPVHEVRRRDVIALVEAIAVDRPVMANRTLGALSKFCNWLVARDVIAASPVHGVEMPGLEKARDRVLDDGELAALWHACTEEGIVGAAVRIMMLTGARRSEVARMAWSEIDEQTRTWVLPAERSKNRQAHVVPLSTTASAILAALPRISNTHVFSVSGDGPIVNFTRIKERLDAKLKFEKHWQPHDLRRSCASGLQRLGVRVEVIEATLGHRSGVFRGITSVYQRHEYAEEKRHALQAWADHVGQLVSGAPVAKVVPISGRR